VKTFFGKPGDPPVVTVADGGKTRTLRGDWGWGRNTTRGGALAKAILVEHLGDEAEATKYYRRFMWRTLAGWDGEKPWAITGDEIDAVLADIRESEKESARMRAAVANERPPVADERGHDISPIRMKS
jgi:hypothetical protein